MSTEGGTEPVWANSGRELFYRDRNGNFVAADIVTSPTFAITRQRTLFSSIGYRFNQFQTRYDVSPDDQRFLMVGISEGEAVEETVVVLNWFRELQLSVGN